MSDPSGSDAGPVLSPANQRQLQIVTYIAAGTAAVFVWDVLNNFLEEYTMFFHKRIRNSAAAAYLLSRISSLVYVLGFTVFGSYPIGACGRAIVVLNSFLPLSSASTALLFFFRVRAIYGGDRTVTAVFFLLWLCVVGTAVTVPIGSTAAPIGASKICIVTKVADYVGAAGAALAVYDTSIFLAISWRLLRDAPIGQDSRAEAVRALVKGRGKGLHAFSRTLFVDGQKFYITSVLSNILALVMIYVPHVPPVYHGVFVLPNVTITNIMAARAYRHAKLHRWGAPEILPSLNFPALTTELRPASVMEVEREGMRGREEGTQRPLGLGADLQSSNRAEH